jgi:hypothetical protein
MKNLYFLFLCLLLSGVANSQSRLVLLEEFTGETCGPCAANNPGMNAILDANPTKVISLKYQNNIPSAGPNFYAYNTTDVGNRTTYYANNYSPHAFIDGNFWDDNAGAVTAALINDRAAAPTPYTVSVSHWFSPTYDSIYTRTVVRVTSDVANANTKLRIAVSERNVYGYTSPNGEDEFSHVMRKLLPNGNGTALPAAITTADSVVVTQAWKITVPTSAVVSKPIWALLEVISWVQNDTDKEILQAGHSPSILTSDAAITQLDADQITCATSVIPSIEIENIEPPVITSMEIEYSINGTNPQTQSWTGSLAQGQTASVTLGSVNINPGSQALNVTIKSINGQSDLVPSNSARILTVAKPQTVATISEGFTTVGALPASMIVVNPDGAATWTRSTAGAPISTGSAKMDFFNSFAGNIDYLYTIDALNLTNVPSGMITFDVSHRRYSNNESDVLEFEASIDCGQTWTTLYSKAGATLASTAGFVTTGFTPTLASQWRKDTVSLASLANNSQVIFRFKATSDYGNNAYIDNITALVTTKTESPVLENSFSVFPNPAKAQITVDFALRAKAELGTQIVNALGQVVHNVTPQSFADGKHAITIPVNTLATGIYFVNIVTNDSVISRTFTVVR